MNESLSSVNKPRKWGKSDTFLALVYVCVTLIMIGLGSWQLLRMDEKRIMLAREAAAASADAVPLNHVVHEIAEAAGLYTRVVLTGEWLPGQQLLWDNRIAAGVAGYEVLTPFKLQSGELVLVNRGWVPVGPSRQTLPDVAKGVSDSAAVVTVEGALSRPSKGLAQGPAIEASPSWPKRLQYLDYSAVNEVYGKSFVPVVVQARGVGDPIVQPWQLLGNWEPTASFGPSRHLGYAVQWFAMAAALTFLYLWNTFRSGRASTSE